MEDTFVMYDENGNEKEAIILNEIEVDNNKYVVYGILEDDENYNIFVSKLVKDENDEPQIISITDPQEKEKVNALVIDYLKEES